MDADLQMTPRLSNQLSFALYQSAQLVTDLYRSQLRDLGLTYPQYLVLILLWEKGAVPMGAICDNLSLDYNSVAPVTRRLEESGYITRAPDPADSRRLIVSLTGAGESLRAESARISGEVAQELPLDNKEIESLRCVLQEMNKALLARNRRRRALKDPRKPHPARAGRTSTS